MAETVQGQYQGKDITVNKSLSHAEQVAQAAAQMQGIDQKVAPAPITKGNASMGPVDEDPIDNDDLDTTSDYLKNALSDYDKLFQEYLGSLQPSPEEALAQQQIDALNAQTDLLSESLHGQGMTVSAVSGQQARIEKMRAIEVGALEQRLGRIQQGRLTKAELLQAAMNGIDHRLEIVSKLQQITMPQLLDHFTDPETGEIFGLFQDMNGNIKQKLIGEMTPEEVKDFDVQGTWDNGSQMMAYGYDKDGNFVTRTLGTSFRASSGGGSGSGLASVAGENNLWVARVQEEMANGASLPQAVSIVSAEADDLGQKLNPTLLYQQVMAAQSGGGSEESSPNSQLPGSGTQSLEDFINSYNDKPAYTPPAEGSLKFNDVNTIDWEKASKFFVDL